MSSSYTSVGLRFTLRLFLLLVLWVWSSLSCIECNINLSVLTHSPVVMSLVSKTSPDVSHAVSAEQSSHKHYCFLLSLPSPVESYDARLVHNKIIEQIWRRVWVRISALAAAAVVLDDDQDDDEAEDALMHIVHTLCLCVWCLLGFSNNRTVTLQRPGIGLYASHYNTEL